MNVPGYSHSPTDPDTPRIARWVPPATLSGMLLGLLFLLEFTARELIERGDNYTLQRVVDEYRKLALEGPAWIRFTPDAELSYRLQPDFVSQPGTGGGVTRHNSAGFRGDEFPPKSATTLRIACFGASTTYGVGVDDNRDTYPAQLETVLRERPLPAGWEDVEVLNLGVGGYTSREILGTMERTIPELQPDVVLIQNAINDVIPRFYPNYRDDYAHFRTNFAPLDVTVLDRMAYRSQAWLAFAYAMGWIRPLSLQSQTQLPMPPVDEALANLAANSPTGYEKNLSRAVAFAQSQGCRVWLLTQAYLDVPAFAGPNEASRRLEGGYRAGLAEHTELVVALAAQSGAGLIRLDEQMPREQRFFTDPIHMSREGNRVKAELIAGAISPGLPAPSVAP